MLKRRVCAAAVLLVLSACQSSRLCTLPTAENSRAQLSLAHSLPYQKADGIPKLNWLLLFKDKPEEVGRVIKGLVDYYKQLSSAMERLAVQYPGTRLDSTTMSEIEANTRKTIGEDMAKDSLRWSVKSLSILNGKRCCSSMIHSTSNATSLA